MVCFKICQEKYAKKLSASGVSNRWNKEDEFVIYSASSIALATLEMVAHRSSIIPNIKYKILKIEIADEEIISLNLKKLPKIWRKIEAYPDLQEIGSSWYHSQKSIVLKVPSAIVPQEFNFIINFKHPDFDKIKLLESIDLNWDSRIL